MGSFASTCCVSGLPIEAGDPVRYFLLMENPYAENSVCEMHGRWVPRTWPVKARYDDYGSIEDWEEGPIQASILRGLALDLVEVGVGDNSAHDVATSKDMSFKTLLEAIWEGRVHVERDLGKTPTATVPDYIPTLQNVQGLISDIPLASGGCYLVDEQGCWVRVRWEGRGSTFRKDAEYLQMVATRLEGRFVTAIVAGSGSYAYDMELWCFAAPGLTQDGHPISTKAPRAKPPLLLRQAMIREDVWQELLTIQCKGWWGEANLERYRADVRTCLAEMRVADAHTKRMMKYTNRGQLQGTQLVFEDTIPFTVGLATHLDLIIENLHDADVTDLADLVAEFSYLHVVLGAVRHVWRPTDSAGPQSGEWDHHEAFHDAIGRVIRAQPRPDL